MSHAKKDVLAVEEKCKDIRDTLQEENSILQEMLNETENMHIVFLDSNFNFVRVNEAYAKTCGYTPEEMIGKNHFALFPGEGAEAIFKRVRDTGVAAKFHDRPFVFPDQPERGVTYWDWTLKPVKNEVGEVEGLVFSLVETTERMKVERKLQERMKELACLYAVSRDVQEDLSVEELCQRTVRHLVPAMQFPEVAVPIIELNSERFTLESYSVGLSHASKQISEWRARSLGTWGYTIPRKGPS